MCLTGLVLQFSLGAVEGKGKGQRAKGKGQRARGLRVATSWALASVADSMKQRIAEFKKNDEKTTSVNDLDMTEMQRKLSVIGSIVSGTVSALTVVSLAFAPKNMKNIPTP